MQVFPALANMKPIRRPDLDMQPRGPALSSVEAIHAHGVTVAEWARAHGFSPDLVYHVLAGRKALRGKSLQIARALGMK